MTGCTVPRCVLDAVEDGLCAPHLYRLRHYGTTYPTVDLGEILPLGVERTSPSLFDQAAT